MKSGVLTASIVCSFLTSALSVFFIKRKLDKRHKEAIAKLLVQKEKDLLERAVRNLFLENTEKAKEKLQQVLTLNNRSFEAHKYLFLLDVFAFCSSQQERSRFSKLLHHLPKLRLLETLATSPLQHSVVKIYQHLLLYSPPSTSSAPSHASSSCGSHPVSKYYYDEIDKLNDATLLSEKVLMNLVLKRYQELEPECNKLLSMTDSSKQQQAIAHVVKSCIISDQAHQVRSHGNLPHKTKLLSLAFAHLNRAIHLVPYFIRALILRATMLVKMNRKTEALLDLDTAHSLNPTSPYTFRLRAQICLTKDDDWNQALFWMNEAFKHAETAEFFDQLLTLSIEKSLRHPETKSSRENFNLTSKMAEEKLVAATLLYYREQEEECNEQDTILQDALRKFKNDDDIMYVITHRAINLLYKGQFLKCYEYCKSMLYSTDTLGKYQSKGRDLLLSILFDVLHFSKQLYETVCRYPALRDAFHIIKSNPTFHPISLKSYLQQVDIQEGTSLTGLINFVSLILHLRKVNREGVFQYAALLEKTVEVYSSSIYNELFRNAYTLTMIAHHPNLLSLSRQLAKIKKEAARENIDFQLLAISYFENMSGT